LFLFVPTANEKPRQHAPNAPNAKTGMKQGEQEFVMNLEGYLWFRMEERVIWEQEVPSSNLGAPTSFSSINEK
jgi:hypothetical protein